MLDADRAALLTEPLLERVVQRVGRAEAPFGEPRSFRAKKWPFTSVAERRLAVPDHRLAFADPHLVVPDHHLTFADHRFANPGLPPNVW